MSEIETDAWRLTEARRLLKQFTDKFDDDNADPKDIADLAIFTLGGLAATLHMSDEAVVKRMTEDGDPI